MKLLATTLRGAYVIELDKLGDHRGFFARTFCADEFRSAGLNDRFVQQNMSESNQLHTLRGMHYQVGSSAEVKYIRCHAGKIFDVIVDIRKDSPTYMQHETFELSDTNYRALYIPQGFAHGFLTLSDHVVVSYLVSAEYSKINERGIRWDDRAFDIEWPCEAPVLSERDLSHKPFDKDKASLNHDYLEN